MGTNVIVINGPPRAGKDTLVELRSKHYRERGHYVAAMSSIDPVREMLVRAGIDTSQKTPADRKLLAGVGALLEEHSDFRTKHCKNRIQIIADAFKKSSPIVFVHMREPEHIDTLEAMLFPLGIKVWRIFVESKRALTDFSNEVDAGVFSMRRNFTIRNDGTLEDLDRDAKHLVNITSMRREFAHAV